MQKELNIKPYRKDLVNAFYYYFLMDKTPDQIKQDILDQTQIKIKDKAVEEAVLELVEVGPGMIDELETYMKDGWKWERLPSFIQSLLMVGAWEIQNTTIDKAITINEMVNYVKEVEPDFDYKFVNALLDKVNKK